VDGGVEEVGEVGAAAGQRFKLGRMGDVQKVGGGRLARMIYKETNSCSLLEFYAGELPYTGNNYPPLIPRSFPVIFGNFLNDFNERIRDPLTCPSPFCVSPPFSEGPP
jgi:hypothetical protein